ncbi:MAG: phosphoglucosamine mutase [bacterium]
MNPLKISVTGVRGIVGKTLTPLLAVRFSEAFATYVGGGDVAVCRDTRPSGGMVSCAVTAGLLAAGARPVDLGVTPVPTMEHLVSRSGVRGGIAVSAGHNPPEWNALKFVGGDGIYLDQREGEELLDIFHLGKSTRAAWNRIPRVKTLPGAADAHLEKILASVDAALIRSARLKIAVDISGGACGGLVGRLLENLGCESVVLNGEPGRKMPSFPEPAPENMGLLETVVRAARADAGFMFDTGGERLGIVTDEGTALAENSTLLVCMLSALRRRPGPVVTNLSTTRAVEIVARGFGVPVFRVPTGQAHVSREAKKRCAAVAGEGSGGVVVPAVQWSQDSIASMALVLDFLAGGGEKLSTAARRLPRLAMRKTGIAMDFKNVHSAMERVRKRVEKGAKGARLDFTDGVRMDWKDSWAHVRASNTESLIRIIAEAETVERAAEISAWAEGLLR